MRPPTRHVPRGVALQRRWLGSLVAGVLFLVAAASAQAVPTVTMNPSGPVVSQMPVFTIVETTPATTIHWTLTGPEGYIEESESDVGSPVTTGQLPLGVDGLYTFTVTETPPAPSPTIVTFTLDTAPPPVPTVLSGPPAVVGPASHVAFSWTGDVAAVSSHWQLLDTGTVIAEGTTSATEMTSLPAFQLSAGDRILRFQVSLLDSVGNPSPFSDPYVFIVDQTPPEAPVALTGPPGITSNLSPTFAWQGTEAGGTFVWNVVDAAGSGILGPGVDRTTTATSLTVPALPLAPNMIHPLVFTVRQLDAYGNSSPDRTVPFTVTTVPFSPAQPTRFANLMQPIAKSTVTTLRPLLRWRRRTPGATFYNVKVYLGSKTKVVQITRQTRALVSIFPASNKARVPKGRLKPGTRYIWYVWEYIGKKKRYAPQPMVSWFETKAP